MDKGPAGPKLAVGSLGPQYAITTGGSMSMGPAGPALAMLLAPIDVKDRATTAGRVHEQRVCWT